MMPPSPSLNDSAIRHRNPHSYQPATALNIRDTNNGNENNKHRRHRRGNSGGSNSNNNNKVYMVLGGGLAVFFLCMTGMWSSSSSSSHVHDQTDIDANSSNNNSVRLRQNRNKPRRNEDIIPGSKRTRNYQKKLATDAIKTQGRTFDNNNEDDDEVRENNSRPIARKKKTNIISDDDATSPTLSTSDSKPRTVYVHLEPIQEQQSSQDSDEDSQGNKHNRYRHNKSFRLTKVKSNFKTPYNTDEFSASERTVSPYPDDDNYFYNVDKINKRSKMYHHSLRDSVDEECQFKYEWQEGAFPNCNVIHEFELGQANRMLGRMARKRLRLREGDGNDLVQYLSHGYWRDVWVLSHRNAPDENHLKEKEELTVLKTLRYEHDFTDRNYDRHRKDALASERLSGSPYVVDIFAFCQNTAVFEYGKGGDIDAKLWPYDEEDEEHYIAELSSREKLDMAYQVACGIADIHSIEEDGIASIAHTDITPSQFIYIDGKWKVNDFNRCRFMREYKKDKSVCGFEVGSNPGKFRSPEEYAYEVETEMIDVYSMGNVFYAILSGLMPFEGMKQENAQKRVMDGKRPKFPSEVLESDDLAIKGIVAAAKKCWAHDPEERPPATEIRDELKTLMERIKKEEATNDA